MKRLLLALVSLFFAGSAYSAPILTFGFFQGGYEEGAFVAGAFRAQDLNGDGRIFHIGRGNPFGPSGGWSCEFPGECEVVDYSMFFSGNSHVSAFVHSGLRALAFVPEGDIDNLVGIIGIDIGWPTIPFGEYQPPGCFEDCTSVPDGFIGSQNWSIRANGTIDPGIEWTVNDPGGFPLVCGPSSDICGLINGGGGSTRTNERVRIFRIPEPPTIALIAFALAGLALTRRRWKQ